MQMTPGWLLAVADEWPSSAETRAFPDLSPSLAEGFAALMRGDCALAIRLFGRAGAETAGQRDATVRVLALHLGYLAENRTYNLLPGGAGAGAAMDASLRWDPLEALERRDAAAAEIRAGPIPADASLASRWIGVAASIPAAVGMLRTGRRHSSQRDQMLQGMRRRTEGARPDAAHLSPRGPGFIERTLAELSRHAGRHDQARAELDAALATCRAAGDLLGVIACRALAADWDLCGHSSALVRNFEIEEAGGPASELPWQVEAQEGAAGPRIEQARRALDELTREADAIDAARCAASIVLRSAFAAGLAGDHTRQVALCEAAVRRFDEANDKLHGYLARTHLALARLEAGQLPVSLEIAHDIGAWGRTDGSFSYALGLGLLMARAARYALLHDGDYERADAGFRLALALNESLGARMRVSQTHADLGIVHQLLGNRDRARTHCETALDQLVGMATQDPDPPSAPHGIAELSHRIVMLSHQMFADAVEHGDAKGIESAHERIEKVDPARGGAAEGFALSKLQQKVGSQSRVLVPLYTGIDEVKLGHRAAADKQFAIALAEAERRREEDGGFMVVTVLATQRRYEEALREYEAYAARGPAQGLTGELLALIGSASSEHSRMELAAAVLRHARMSFMMMIRFKAHARARDYLTQLESLAGVDWWQRDPEPWQPLTDLGRMYEGLGQLEDAARHYRLATDRLEQRRALMSVDELKTAFAGDYSAQLLYFRAARTELERGQLASAFELSERARARGLLDLVATNLRRPSGVEEPAALQRWRALTTQSQVWRGLVARLRASAEDDAAARRAALETRLAACERELHETIDQLAIELPRFADAVRGEAIAGLDELIRELPPRTAMLQYMTLGEELLAWAITGDGMQRPTEVEIHATDLALLTRDLHEACARGLGDEALLPPARRLAEILLAPFDDVIASHDHLIVVPYGELHRLPFAALPWRGAWLGEARTLSHVPSASLFVTLRRSRASSSPKAMLAVGGPEDMRQVPPLGGEARALEPLPMARDEARYIAALYGEPPLLGPDATREHVLAALDDHRLFHFGTHGLLYPDAPLLSGLALAHGEILTVQDLLALRFEADLVTVSACETALGVLTGGEEIVGLSRGLLAAGARCVIVSLWPVLDGATALLMSRFYDALHGGASPSRALQHAQGAMRALTAEALHAGLQELRDLDTAEPPPVRDGRHPLYWAPFIVVGDWQGELP